MNDKYWYLTTLHGRKFTIVNRIKFDLWKPASESLTAAWCSFQKATTTTTTTTATTTTTTKTELRKRFISYKQNRRSRSLFFFCQEYPEE